MNRKIPLVTIAIPTYNRANKTLYSSIRCACNQDYANLEIIVSDNCSTDNTQETIYSFDDQRLKYIRQPTNIGSNRNYNACLNAAAGDYFLLLHDDDLIDSDFVSTCMQQVDYSLDYGVIRTGTRIIGINGEHLKDEPNLVFSNNTDEMFLAWVTWKTSFYLCSTLFNTAALKKIGGFKSKNNLFEDGVAIIKLSADYPVFNIVDIKASFRQHAEQRTNCVQALKWSEDFRIALDMIYIQKPAKRRQIYQIGMQLFAKTSHCIALKIKNPVRRVIAVIGVGRYFPYYYWPNSPRISLRSRIARFMAILFFHRKKCLLRQKDVLKNANFSSFKAFS